MAGEKRFRNSFIGFKKSDVSAYLENIINEYNDQLLQRDEEIATLKSKNAELEAKYAQIQEKADTQLEQKELIANTLLSAEQKAEEIIRTAEAKAEEERKKLEAELEEDREKIVEAKAELKQLRKQALDTVKNFSSKLQGIVEKETETV